MDTFKFVGKKLAERYEFNRDNSSLPFGRCISFDVTRLLPYLYRKYAGQVIATAW